jgi:PAS domain S-box-containing protein
MENCVTTNLDLIDEAPIAISNEDLDGNVIYCNKRYKSLFQIKESSEILSLKNVVVKTDEKRINNYLDSIRNNKNYKNNIEFTALSVDGCKIQIECKISLIQKDDIFTGYCFYMQDSKKHKFESQIKRDKDNNLSSIFENATIGIYRTTPNGGVVLANPALLKMLRFPDFDTLANHNLEKESGDLLYRSDEFKYLINKDGFVRALESEWTRYDGTLILVSENTWIVRDINGKVIYYEGFIEDITTRKQAEEEKERLIEQLQSALTEVRTLSGLLPICAHCKSIRDDAGYWYQIEEYLNNNSNAMFSHGICPTCAQKLYPEYADPE